MSRVKPTKREEEGEVDIKKFQEYVAQKLQGEEAKVALVTSVDGQNGATWKVYVGACRRFTGTGVYPCVMIQDGEGRYRPIRLTAYAATVLAELLSVLPVVAEIMQPFLRTRTAPAETEEI